MAFKKKCFYETFGAVLVLSASLSTASGVSCNGKTFHCVNSTHFMICVDLGGGVSQSIDDFLIPCPPPTICHGTNHFECEFPAPTTPLPTLNVISETTQPWEDVVVTTNSPQGKTTKEYSEKYVNTESLSFGDGFTTDATVYTTEASLSSPSIDLNNRINVSETVSTLPESNVYETTTTVDTLTESISMYDATNNLDPVPQILPENITTDVATEIPLVDITAVAPPSPISENITTVVATETPVVNIPTVAPPNSVPQTIPENIIIEVTTEIPLVDIPTVVPPSPVPQTIPENITTEVATETPVVDIPTEAPPNSVPQTISENITTEVTTEIPLVDIITVDPLSPMHQTIPGMIQTTEIPLVDIPTVVPPIPVHQTISENIITDVVSEIPLVDIPTVVLPSPVPQTISENITTEVATEIPLVDITAVAPPSPISANITLVLPSPVPQAVSENITTEVATETPVVDISTVAPPNSLPQTISQNITTEVTTEILLIDIITVEPPSPVPQTIPGIIQTTEIPPVDITTVVPSSPVPQTISENITTEEVTEIPLVDIPTVVLPSPVPQTILENSTIEVTTDIPLVDIPTVAPPNSVPQILPENITIDVATEIPLVNITAVAPPNSVPQTISENITTEVTTEIPLVDIISVGSPSPVPQTIPENITTEVTTEIPVVDIITVDPLSPMHQTIPGMIQTTEIPLVDIPTMVPPIPVPQRISENITTEVVTEIPLVDIPTVVLPSPVPQTISENITTEVATETPVVDIPTVAPPNSVPQTISENITTEVTTEIPLVDIISVEPLSPVPQTIPGMIQTTEIPLVDIPTVVPPIPVPQTISENITTEVVTEIPLVDIPTVVLPSPVPQTISENITTEVATETPVVDIPTVAPPNSVPQTISENITTEVTTEIPLVDIISVEPPSPVPQTIPGMIQTTEIPLVDIPTVVPPIPVPQTISENIITEVVTEIPLVDIPTVVLPSPVPQTISENITTEVTTETPVVDILTVAPPNSVPQTISQNITTEVTTEITLVDIISVEPLSPVPQTIPGMIQTTEIPLVDIPTVVLPSPEPQTILENNTTEVATEIPLVDVTAEAPMLRNIAKETTPSTILANDSSLDMNVNVTSVPENTVSNLNVNSNTTDDNKQVFLESTINTETFIGSEQNVTISPEKTYSTEVNSLNNQFGFTEELVSNGPIVEQTTVSYLAFENANQPTSIGAEILATDATVILATEPSPPCEENPLNKLPTITYTVVASGDSNSLKVTHNTQEAIAKIPQDQVLSITENEYITHGIVTAEPEIVVVTTESDIYKNGLQTDQSTTVNGNPEGKPSIDSSKATAIEEVILTADATVNENQVKLIPPYDSVTTMVTSVNVPEEESTIQPALNKEVVSEKISASIVTTETAINSDSTTTESNNLSLDTVNQGIPEAQMKGSNVKEIPLTNAKEIEIKLQMPSGTTPVDQQILTTIEKAKVQDVIGTTENINAINESGLKQTETFQIDGTNAIGLNTQDTKYNVPVTDTNTISQTNENNYVMINKHVTNTPSDTVDTTISEGSPSGTLNTEKTASSGNTGLELINNNTIHVQRQTTSQSTNNGTPNVNKIFEESIIPSKQIISDSQANTTDQVYSTQTNIESVLGNDTLQDGKTTIQSNQGQISSSGLDTVENNIINQESQATSQSIDNEIPNINKNVQGSSNSQGNTDIDRFNHNLEQTKVAGVLVTNILQQDKTMTESNQVQIGSSGLDTIEPVTLNILATVTTKLDSSGTIKDSEGHLLSTVYSKVNKTEITADSYKPVTSNPATIIYTTITIPNNPIQRSDASAVPKAEDISFVKQPEHVVTTNSEQTITNGNRPDIGTVLTNTNLNAKTHDNGIAQENTSHGSMPIQEAGSSVTNGMNILPSIDITSLFTDSVGKKHSSTTGFISGLVSETTQDETSPSYENNNAGIKNLSNVDAGNINENASSNINQQNDLPALQKTPVNGVEEEITQSTIPIHETTSNGTVYSRHNSAAQINNISQSTTNANDAKVQQNTEVNTAGPTYKPVTVSKKPVHKITSSVQSTTSASVRKTAPKAVSNVTENPKKQIVENTVNFSCTNGIRRRYSDKNDCRKFYICVGTVGNTQPIVGQCPVNTVFSEIKKQCTKNMSHCIRDNEFKCPSGGRFSDVVKENVYYICVNYNSHLYRFKFQCQQGFTLNKNTVRCIENKEVESNESVSISSDNISDSSSQSASSSSTSSSSGSSSGSSSSTASSSSGSSSSSSSTSTAISRSSTSGDSESSSSRSKKKKEYSESKDGDDDDDAFECEKEGKFRVKNDCKRYYLCKKNGKGEYRRKLKKCESGEVFHKKKRKCVDEDDYEC